MQSSSGFLMLLALYTFIALSNPTKKVIEPEKSSEGDFAYE
jgi:hypothetical protein